MVSYDNEYIPGQTIIKILYKLQRNKLILYGIYKNEL